MSDESVELVRRFNAPYDGEDVIPTIVLCRVFFSEAEALAAIGEAK